MSYKDIIEGIQAIPYSKYKSISSNEKLAVYAAYYLSENDVPLYFNYICIASFKFFPDKFCCDEEFKEYPSVDRLNRTLLHMHTNRSSAYLTGTVKNGFKITKLGRLVAKQVSDEINNVVEDNNEKAPVVDLHKKGFIQEYTKFIESEFYKNFVENNMINIDYLWKLYRVIPYSRVTAIKKDLDNVRARAQEIGDTNCVECIDELIKQL